MIASYYCAILLSLYALHLILTCIMTRMCAHCMHSCGAHHLSFHYLVQLWCQLAGVATNTTKCLDIQVQVFLLRSAKSSAFRSSQSCLCSRRFPPNIDQCWYVSCYQKVMVHHYASQKYQKYQVPGGSFFQIVVIERYIW